MTRVGRRDPRRAARGFARQALLMLAVVFAGLIGAALALLGDMDPAERGQVAALATPQRIGIAVVVLALVVTGIVQTVRAWHARTAAPARRLAESVRLVASRPEHRATPEGTAELREAAAAVNELAEAHARLRADLEARVAAARAEVEAEKNRLAALMSELRSSVLVCNAEGRILLYNGAARRLLGGADGELVGLGRSVFGVLDRDLILHVLDQVERLAAQGEHEPTAQFVAAGPGGGLLRLTLAPVPARGGEAGVSVGGFVLLAVDVTEAIEQGGRRDALLQSVTENARGALATMRAAIENLIDYPDMPTERRQRFTAIVRDEAVRLSGRLEEVTREYSEAVRSQWPLETMRGEDLVSVARARIEARLGVPTKIESVDPAVWLRVDSFPVAQALSYLAARLKDEFSVREVRFRVAAAGRHAHVDILWSGAPLSPETAYTWENEPFRTAGEESPLTLKGVLERHHGEVWYTRDRPSQLAYFRLVLPLEAAQAQVRRAASGLESRPEFYDFDLFRVSASARALDERPLGELAYTVFDTETTGLDPRAGDEIIAIGAVRVVNGKLLHGETFESLVDPRRPMSPESIAVHGITPDMLEGQPVIGDVLPRFHRFAADTVLLGHNAAFDMRFLEIKQAALGMRFDPPVLDTLLLSAVAQPNQETHSLEAIAERLGVPIVGRHTALGDALVTGEVFVRLLPLLARQGVRTLREAREASARTFYARVTY